MGFPSDDATSERPRTRYRVLGRIAALAILYVVLVEGPRQMIQLNAEWQWPRWQIPGGRLIGSALMVGTVAVWLYCSRLFERVGKGTPFVTEPPQQLVTVGLYGYSRNPIYVAHVAFLLGWFLRSGCPAVLLYTGVIVALIHATIVWLEEPGLRERFGEAYVRYTHTVPRWLSIRPAERA